MVHAVPNSEHAPQEECGSGLWTRGEDLVPPSTLALAEICLPGQKGPSPLRVLSFVGSGGTFDRLCLLSMEEANLRPRPGTGAGTVSAGLQLVPVCVCVCVQDPASMQKGQSCLGDSGGERQWPASSGPSPDCRAQNVGLEARPGPRSLPLSAHPPRLPFSFLLNTSSCWAVTFSPALRF